MKAIPSFENDPALTIKQIKRRRYYYSHREDSIRKSGLWVKKNPDMARASQRRYKNLHRDSVRRKSREGKAIWRIKNPEKTKLAIAEWYKKNMEKVKIKKLQFKQEVMDAYGGFCACCGERAVEFLSLDHIHNDGAEERRINSSASGSSFYRMLKRLGYPKGRLQVLCYNCNFSKGYYGACPHEIQIAKIFGKVVEMAPISRPRKNISSVIAL